MLPTLGVPKERILSNGFINAYINDELHSLDYANCAYLLFKPTDIDNFKEFLDEEYERTKNIIEDYDYKDGYVVVVYELDKTYEKDFELIKQGKYSKTSKTFQKLFPENVKLNNSVEKSLQYKIFNKTQDLIDYWEDVLGLKFDEDKELWEGFDLKRETLNINKLKI